MSANPGPDELAEKCRVEAYEQYDNLIQMGGRPRAPIRPDPGVWDDAVHGDEHLHVYNHWGMESSRTLEELDRWKAFLEYQQLRRENPVKFEQYKETLLANQKQGERQWCPTLELELETQSKLDDWQEDYSFEHRKLLCLERKTQRIKQLPEEDQWWGGKLKWAEGDLQEHEELLEWIRYQFRFIEAETSGSKNNTGRRARRKQDRSPRAATRLSKRIASKISYSQTPAQGSSRKAVRSKVPSAPSAVHASKVSKGGKKRQSPRFRHLSEVADKPIPPKSSVCTRRAIKILSAMDFCKPSSKILLFLWYPLWAKTSLKRYD